MLASIEGVVCALAPEKHTNALVVQRKAADVEILVSDVISALLKAWAADADGADHFPSFELLLIAKKALEVISEIVQLGDEMTPLETPPLERQAARVAKSIHHAQQDMWPAPDVDLEGQCIDLRERFATAQVGSCELLILCCGQDMKPSSCVTRAFHR